MGGQPHLNQHFVYRVRPRDDRYLGVAVLQSCLVVAEWLTIDAELLETYLA